MVSKQSNFEHRAKQMLLQSNKIPKRCVAKMLKSTASSPLDRRNLLGGMECLTSKLAATCKIIMESEAKALQTVLPSVPNIPRTTQCMVSKNSRQIKEHLIFWIPMSQPVEKAGQLPEDFLSTSL